MRSLLLNTVMWVTILNAGVAAADDAADFFRAVDEGDSATVTRLLGENSEFLNRAMREAGISHGFQANHSALIRAAREGHIETARLLIDRCAELELEIPSLRTPEQE